MIDSKPSANVSTRGQPGEGHREHVRGLLPHLDEAEQVTRSQCNRARSTS